jgi:hypothetical protein
MGTKKILETLVVVVVVVVVIIYVEEEEEEEATYIDCIVPVLLSGISDDRFYIYVHRPLEDTLNMNMNSMLLFTAQ